MVVKWFYLYWNFYLRKHKMGYNICELKSCNYSETIILEINIRKTKKHIKTKSINETNTQSPIILKQEWAINEKKSFYRIQLCVLNLCILTMDYMKLYKICYKNISISEKLKNFVQKFSNARILRKCLSHIETFRNFYQNLLKNCKGVFGRK